MTQDLENEAVTEEIAEPQQEAHTNQDDKEHNFRALREQVSNYQRDNDQLQSRLHELERSYQSAQVQPSQQTNDDEDLLTKGELKRLLAQKEQAFQQQLTATQIRAQYRDYDDVVNREVFEDIKRDNPGIAEAIMSSQNPDLLAYTIAKNSPAYQTRAAKKKQQKSDADQIYQNSMKPGSITQGTTGGGAISKTSYFENMTPQEFEAHVDKVKRNGNWGY